MENDFPQVAQGPYTARQGSRTDEWTVTSANKALLAVVFETAMCPNVEAQARLFAASWELLAACEAAILNAERWDDLDADSLAILTQMCAAVAKSRGIRPCDDPALVPEVLQAQPQCVHGEKRQGAGPYPICPVHQTAAIGTERHTHPSGGWWFTYICHGFLSEQKESAE